VEKRVLALDEKIFTSKDREILRQSDDSTRRKALALLWAYLNRIDLDDDTLNEGMSSR
jgi:translocation protein SEC63